MLRKYLVLGALASVFLLLAMFVPQNDAAGVCRAFLHDRGVETEGDPTEEVISLPSVQDPTWAHYLSMQKENGFDMTPYCGKEVRKLVFSVTNYPFDGPVFATIYWADGQILGGDIMSPALSGFMHGLASFKFRQN